MKIRSKREYLRTFGPSVLIAAGVAALAYHFVDPAPPKHLVISTGDDDGDYHLFAKQYQGIMKEDGVELEIRPSSGVAENLRRLDDPNSDVEVAFMQDGFGSAEHSPDLSSLGSLYYEPIWVFYRKSLAIKGELNRFAQLKGRRLAVGQVGGGTHQLVARLLKEAGVDPTNATFVPKGSQAAVEALHAGQVDAAFFIRTPEDPLVSKLMHDPALKLLDADQAEAIARRNPFLHHLVLPHGTIDLAAGIPAKDVNLVSPTATLLVKDTLHPALAYLLLKAASQVHDDPGIFEKRAEFPQAKDDEFPLSGEAKHFYKAGAPFWQRYLPFWLATLVERLILVAIPAFAIILPIFRLIPRFLNWRVKSRIFQRYGELKLLETRLAPAATPGERQKHLAELDGIEERVNRMKVPLDFSDQVYVLREHIELVRRQISRTLARS